MNKIRFALLTLGCLAAAAGQSFDTSATSSLKGSYFLRELAFTVSSQGAITRAFSVFGPIVFDGNGGYTFNGQLLDSSKSTTQPQSYSVSGGYAVAANGMAQIQSLIADQDFIFGAFTQSVFAGSSTEGQLNDLIIAIPAGVGASNAALQGSYRVGAIEFPQGNVAMVRDSYFTLNADGGGKMANITVNGSAANLGSTNQTQTISGATYSITANSSGTASFPAATSGGTPNQLFTGSKTLYVSADGNFILGGATNGFDIFFGVRPPSGQITNGAYKGTYFVAGLENSTAGLNGVQSNINSFYGATNALGVGEAINHLRLNSVLNGIYDYTYDFVYNFATDGTSTDNAFHFDVGLNGNAEIIVGRGQEFQLTVGLHAQDFSGSGVFLNPVGIVNAASLAPVTNPVAPNQAVSLFGSGLSSVTMQAQSFPIPTSLGGVQVMVNNLPARLFFVSPGQINVIVPSGIATNGYAVFQVINNGVNSNQVTLFTSPTAPGIFTQNQAGFGAGAILHVNGSLVSPQNPAAVGETVSVFLTGLGATNPAVVDGAAALANPLSTVTDQNLFVDFDGTSATVSFAGLAPGFAGLYQINVQVPQGLPTGNHFLDISTSDAYHSQAMIAIR